MRRSLHARVRQAHSVLFKIRTTSFMMRGADISYFEGHIGLVLLELLPGCLSRCLAKYLEYLNALFRANAEVLDPGWKRCHLNLL